MSDVAVQSFKVHEVLAFENPAMNKMLRQRQKYTPLRSLQSSIDQVVDQVETGAGQSVYDACLQMAAEEATIGNTCTCNLFEDGMVQLDCEDNCIYCGNDDTSSCANFSYSTNVTESMGFGQVRKAKFQYNGGDRNEIISFEEVGCDDDGVCNSCRIYVNGSLCNSCYFCTVHDQQGSLLQEGLVVDCENVVANSTFDHCVAPPGPGVFEFIDYNTVDCVVPARSNSNCNSATPVFLGDDVEGTLNGTMPSNEADISCFENVGIETSGGGTWYSFVGTGDLVVLKSCSSDFSQFISMYSGSCGALECVAPATWNFTHQCLDYDYGYQSMPIQTEAEKVYYVLISSEGSIVEGSFVFSLETFLPAKNVNCAEAVEIAPDGQLVAASTNGVTYETFSNNCAFFSQSPGLWYAVNGTGGVLRADTCSGITNFDTVISVYRGFCDNLMCVGTVDDSCASLTSSITWETELSVTYYIRVYGHGELETGDFGLTVSTFEPAVNDLCDGAVALIAGEEVQGTLEGASDEGAQSSCFSDISLPSLWYYIDGTGTGVKASVCLPNSTLSGGMQVFRGTICSDLVCEGPEYVENFFTDSECAESSVATRFFAENGVRYYVSVYGFDPNAGANSTFSVSVDEFDIAENDICETALPVNMSDLSIFGSTNNALPDNITCGFSVDLLSPGVWYTMIGTGSSLVVSTCTSELSIDASLHVFSGDCGDLECIATGYFDFEGCDQSFSGSTRVVFMTEVGVEYFIHVGGSDSNTAVDFGLTIREAQAPPNDRCSDTITIEPSSGNMIGSISDATGFFNLNITCPYSFAAPTVWYSLIGTGDVYAISTCSSELNFDAGLIVFTGDCDSQECITTSASNTFDCSESFFGSAKVVFRTQVDVEYFIAVQSVNFSSQGDFSLTITTEEVTPNDVCTGALVIAADNSTIFGSTEGATSSGITNATCTGFDTSPDLWYRVEGMGTSLTATLCSETTVYDSKIAVFEGIGEECNQSCIISNDDFCGTSSEVEWFAELGVTYFIRVYGFLESSGPFELRVF